MTSEPLTIHHTRELAVMHSHNLVDNDISLTMPDWVWMDFQHKLNHIVRGCHVTQDHGWVLVKSLPDQHGEFIILPPEIRAMPLLGG